MGECVGWVPLDIVVFSETRGGKGESGGSCFRHVMITKVLPLTTQRRMSVYQVDRPRQLVKYWREQVPLYYQALSQCWLNVGKHWLNISYVVGIYTLSVLEANTRR